MPDPDAPILILDDSESDRALLHRALAPAAPCRPMHAVGRAAEALAWLEAHAGAGPALLVLDRWLERGQDGLEVLAAVRAREDLLTSRVVLLSGAQMPAADRARAVGLGVCETAMLVKPMDLEGWTRIAREILVRSVSAPPAARALVPSDVWVGSGQQPLPPMTNPAAVLLPYATEIEACLGTFPRLGELFKSLFSGSLGATVAPPQSPMDVESFQSARERELLAVCRRHGIRLIVAVDLDEDDQATVAKRHGVIAELRGLGWSDTEIRAFFPYTTRTLRRIRERHAKKPVRSVSALGR